MDSNKEIATQIIPLIRAYTDGTIERLFPSDSIPPSVDPVTGVASKDIIIDSTTGLSARIFIPDLTTIPPSTKLPILLYFHGGGFVIMSPRATIFHNFLNSVVSKANVIAVSLDYRLAPEHPIPAAYEDALTAFDWVKARAAAENEPWLSNTRVDFDRIFLAGDSCGANMAHNVAMHIGEVDGASIEGALLLFPYFWGTERLPSEETRENDTRFLNPDEVDKLWPFVSGKGHDDPRVNPMAKDAPSLAKLGCRRVLIEVAEIDSLSERGKLYGEELKKSGWSGEVEVFETEGEDHDFVLFKPGTDKAIEFLQRQCGFINKN